MSKIKHLEPEKSLLVYYQMISNQMGDLTWPLTDRERGGDEASRCLQRVRLRCGELARLAP